MNSTIESFPKGSSSVPTASPTRSMWGRLLWKDAREVVPIWVTLLLAAMLCLSVSLWMVNSNIAHIAPMFISGHTFIALISVITGVFLLASENENRTLHLLRNLPLPPKQIVSQKLALGSVGVIALACFIAVFTMVLATYAQCKPLEAGSSYHFTFANVFLLPLLYLVIASLSSMISRSHFYGVLIAGVVCAGAIAILEPTWLGARESNTVARGETRWLWVALATVTGVGGLVLGATGWVEEKVIAKAPSKRHTSKLTQINQRSTDFALNPFPVLLWQSLRQSRSLLLCCLCLTIAGWITIFAWIIYDIGSSAPSESAVPIVKTVFTLLWTLTMTAMFASSIFLDDKRQSNYLFFQQNRERSKWFWLSRLLPFWAMAFLITLLWNFFVFDLGADVLDGELYGWYVDRRAIELRTSIGLQAASQSFLVPLLAMVGIIGIGQYFSMFVRNPILSFVFTGVVSVVFAGLMSYVVFVNESVWLFVVPTVVAVYVATWWRSRSWLATSPHAGNYFAPIVIPAIVFTVLAGAFIHHRATEYGDVKYDATNFASWNNGGLLDYSDQNRTNVGLQSVVFGVEAQRQQAAKLYKEAADLYRGNFTLMDNTNPLPWPAEKAAKFVDANQAAINKIMEASQLPACEPFLSADPDLRANQRWALQQMALVNSYHQLLKNDLPAAKLSIDAYDRVSQRSYEAGSRTRYESGYYGLLIAWADHPQQKLETLQSAIAQLEGSASDVRPAKIVNAFGAEVSPDTKTALTVSRLFRELGGERAFMNLQYVLADLREDNPNHDYYSLKQNYRLVPWEYQRLTKVAQIKAIQQFELTQTIIGGFGLRNDRSIEWQTIHDFVARRRLWPHLSIDEDRMDFPRYGTSFNTLENAHWRRYTLLRLGLAAFKIEHDQYPDTLIQLDSYYEYGLPTTTDQLMFGWFKNGLGADLIEAEYEDVEFEKLKSAEKLVDGNLPLLLPFSIHPIHSLPTPIEYKEGKLGIDVAMLHFDRAVYVPNYRHSHYYKTTWTVGRPER